MSKQQKLSSSFFEPKSAPKRKAPSPTASSSSSSSSSNRREPETSSETRKPFKPLNSWLNKPEMKDAKKSNHALFNDPNVAKDSQRQREERTRHREIRRSAGELVLTCVEVHLEHSFMQSVVTARSIVRRGLNGNNAEVLDFLVQLLLALGCDSVVLAPASPLTPQDLRALPLVELERRLARIAFRSRPAPASRQFASINTKLLRPVSIGHVRALLGLAADMVAAETSTAFEEATDMERSTLAESFMEVLELILMSERSASGWYSVLELEPVRSAFLCVAQHALFCRTASESGSGSKGSSLLTAKDCSRLARLVFARLGGSGGNDGGSSSSGERADGSGSSGRDVVKEPMRGQIMLLLDLSLRRLDSDELFDELTMGLRDLPVHEISAILGAITWDGQNKPRFLLHFLYRHILKASVPARGSAASERWEYDVHRWLTEQEEVAEVVKDDVIEVNSDDDFVAEKKVAVQIGMRAALANMSSSYKNYQKLGKEKKIIAADAARQEDQRAKTEAKEHQAALLDLMTSQLRLEDST